MLQANTTSLRNRLLATAAVIALSATGVFAGGAASPGAPQQPAAPQAAAPAAPMPGAPGTNTDISSEAASVAASQSDWPCVQVKINKIDSAAVWDGPSIDGVKGYTDDDTMYQLVKTALTRRTPMPDVEKSIESYAKAIPEAERDTKLTQLFSGVLETANTQRNGIVNGIERYQKRQRTNAKEIESQGSAIADLESTAPTDLTQPTPQLDAAREKYDWFARVFQERQGNIPIACEIPTLIEQRVFAVARAIRAQMKS